MLIGMDNAHLLIPLEIKLGSKTSDPYATRTMLGWSLNGPVGDRQNQPVFSHCISVEQQISNLWKMEAHDEDTLAMSLEDKQVLELWNKEIYYEDVHYSLPIPWKGGRPNLPNNRFMAVKRLSSLVHRLHKSGKMRVYEDGISDLLSEGYAEAVPPDEIHVADGSVWYLPHHPVISEAKPDKVRIVFDCAAELRGVSLNTECWQGTDLANKLLHVLLRFRQYEFAVAADIQAMYHQVKIPVKDRDALRFLWLEGDHIREYRMTSHLFGGI